MSILGIDPSLNGTGLCWSPTHAESVIFKGNKLGDQRFRIIRESVARALAELVTVKLVVIELPPQYGSGSASLHRVQGVIREAIASHAPEAKVLGCYPSSLKKWATGSGKADKAAMLEAMLPEFRPHASSWDDNQVDAWWLRFAGAAGCQFLKEVK